MFANRLRYPKSVKLLLYVKKDFHVSKTCKIKQLIRNLSFGILITLSIEVQKFLAEVNDFSGKEGHEMFLKGSLHKIATHFSPISNISNLAHYLFTVFNVIDKTNCF